MTQGLRGGMVCMCVCGSKALILLACLAFEDAANSRPSEAGRSMLACRQGIWHDVQSAPLGCGSTGVNAEGAAA